jgi:hypothetical protein
MLPVLKYKKYHMSSSSFQDAFQINCSAVVGYQAVYRQDIQYISFLFLSVADPGCLPRIRIFSIPDPGSEFFQSRIRIEEFKYFCPKNCFKVRGNIKYDQGCSSRFRIPDPDPDFLSIPGPGSRAQKGTGSRMRITTISYFVLVKCSQHSVVAVRLSLIVTLFFSLMAVIMINVKSSNDPR